MGLKKVAVLGWSRTKVELDADAIVLDVGAGAWPNDAATIACDRSLDEDIHRTGRATKVDRPFVICDATALPFRNGAIDFVIASHIAEHIDDPEAFCGELERAAKAGYIETPSPLADYMLDEEYHQWRVGGRGAAIRFSRKAAKRGVAKWLTDRFYRVFYAGRDTGTPTYPLPGGPLGRALGFVLFVIRGVLNRTGLMHTSIMFSPADPLRCEVDRSAAGGRRVAIIERGPRSGFVEGDRAVIEQGASTRVVQYPGWPSPRFLLDTWHAVGWSQVVYTFFASEQAVVAAVFARLRRRRFVVSVGGYDVANVPEHRYGLPSRFPHRLLPRAVMALSDQIVAFSNAARDEALAAGADPQRTTVSYIGLEPRFVDAPEGIERDPQTVITVAYVDEVSWSRKGIDRFVDAARADPDRRYVLVGRVADPVLAGGLADPPPNLILTGFVSDDELRDLLWSSGVYAQLSWHEGFGVSMVEAMQAGCRPVVTDVPALTEIAGPAAVMSRDPSDDVRAIQHAASAPADRAGLARWAVGVASMDDRALRLESALFGGD
jgi:glycosyltransferase involved in cell wall biosynthesis